MTTLILATIGIILAAAAAVMTVFYGGGMYVDGAVTARADTVTEAGRNIVAGYNTYELRNGAPPSDISDMVRGTGDPVMAAIPTVGDIGSVEQHWVALDRGRGLERAFAVSGISDDVCSRINRLAGNPGDTPTSPQRDFGCYRAQGEVSVYYAFVGPMAPGDHMAAFAAASAS